ncbi:DUF3560 domain-containing protein [Eoetvoesiella caeni]
MNNYEAKQQARKDRYLAKSQSLTDQAATTYERARTMAEVIPFGQPILIGHHSENRDRNYRNRIHTTYGKAFAEQDKADHYAHKAEGVGTGGISSDDPDAIEKLTAQVQALRKNQDLMKAANRLIRKHSGDPEKQVSALVLAGFAEDQAQKVITPDFAGRIGFASYSLTNNNANIRRIEQRIKQLEVNRQRQPAHIEGNGYEYIEDTDENRAMFVFSGKPPKETRDVLKRHGFRWSPSRNAWVRQLNNAAIYSARSVRAELDAAPSA